MGSGWWMADLFQGGEYVLLFGWIVWVIFSICMHELAHGWAALRQGDDTPHRLGHMTWNPLVHMGPFSLLVFAIVGIAWGAMPVQPMNFREGRIGDAKVAGAGPAMNFGLAGIAIVGLIVVLSIQGFRGTSNQALDNLEIFFRIGGVLNIVLGLFNLIPVPPFDGSVILASFSPGYERLLQHPNAQMAGFAVLAVAFFTGAFGFLFSIGRFVTDGLANMASGLIAPPPLPI
ncbi:MAG: site-2 protease family protein [Phycisphaerales bacterium]